LYDENDLDDIMLRPILGDKFEKVVYPKGRLNNDKNKVVKKTGNNEEDDLDLIMHQPIYGAEFERLVLRRHVSK
jgi:hypothetical protein